MHFRLRLTFVTQLQFLKGLGMQAVAVTPWFSAKAYRRAGKKSSRNVKSCVLQPLAYDHKTLSTKPPIFFIQTLQYQLLYTLLVP